MKFITTFLFIFILPITSFGAGLVSCDGVTVKCDYDAFIELVNNVIKFIMVNLALPLAAIAFAYAGFLFLTSAENPGQRTQAKSIFTNVLIGLLLIGTAFLLVKLVLEILKYKNAGSLGF